MKFDVLRSIGHNIAASLASGDSILTGGDISPYAELEGNPDGFIYVNFLTGTSNSLSPCFRYDVARFGEALPVLCQKHGTSPAIFRRLEAKYISDAKSQRFLVMVEDQQGRRSTDIYVGPGARLQVLDRAGRIRRMRGPVIGA